ncbi:MAG: IPT/TIG domain-containing protein [Candidatus Methanoperedens sp.]|nr:IPT/TIG domain-containing protein [Candidatus Methanoperedens sp.]
MKNLKIGITAMMLLVLLAVVASAAVPAPPVNQNLGLPDTKFQNVSVDLCRGCHPGAADIHHFMVSGGPGSNMNKTTTLGCGDCHPIIGGQLTISRNCHDCHDGTAWSVNQNINMTTIRGAPGRPHHNTTKRSASSTFNATHWAADRHCTNCHSDGYLDNYDDGHYVPPYNASMVTPMASYKINDSGKLWGGCLACHDAGTVGTTPVYNSDDTHHTVRFWVGYQCNNCHVSSGFRAEPIPDYNPEPSAAALRVWYNQSYPSYTTMFGWDTTKTHFELRNSTLLNAGDTINGTGCEKCHSVRDLHNIETPAPDLGLSRDQVLAGEVPGYGHIGNNSDCSGCHAGWKGGVVNPFQGPKAMQIDSVTPGVLVAGVATDIAIAGNNFVESPYTAKVLVDGVATTTKSITDSAIVVTVNLGIGVHSVVVQKDVATTVLTTVIALKPGTIASAKLSGTTLTITGAGLGAGQTMVVVAKADGTLKASDSITSSTDTQTVAVASQAAVGDTVQVITPTGKATKIIESGIIPPTNGIKVTSPNGGEPWKQKTTQVIKWTKVGQMGSNAKIEILLGGVVKKTITTANTGTYNWAIGTQALGTTYKVRITSVNVKRETYSIYTDTSDNTFSIVK